MISYNNQWLFNLKVLAFGKEEHKNASISHDEWEAIQKKYSAGFYTPNVFVRIGLFILTCIICSFSAGFLSLILLDSNLVDTFGWFFFLGIAHYATLEFLIKNKPHFKSGVDDALLWICFGLMVTGFVLATYKYHNYLPVSVFVFLISLFFSLRFADRLGGIIAFCSFLACVYFAWARVGTFGTSTMPFVIIIISFFIYRAASLYLKKNVLSLYDKLLVITQIAGLLTFYLAGNFFVVHQLNAFLQGNPADIEHPGLPFGMFFWAWTLLIPFAYVAFGIKRKDTVLLRTGLLLVAAAVYTFRTYFHLLPIEVALTLAGTVLIGVSYGLIKYLEVPKHGITYKEQEESDFFDAVKVESLITAQISSQSVPAPINTGTEFGGGQFGGGGSTGGY